MENRLFKKYYAALAKEGIIKAIVCGLIVGLFLSGVLITIALFEKQNWLWFGILVVLISVVLVSPLLYFTKFRPTSRQIAFRVDRLGLEERLTTMLELSNDISYMAMCQREDAKEKLKNINHKQIKYSLSRLSVTMLTVLALLWTALGALSVFLADSKTPIKPPDPFTPEYIRVSYIASIGGYIIGESEQLVVKGEDSIKVVAIPNEGFIFEGWSDFTDNAERFDKKINIKFSVTARFAPLKDSSVSGGTPNSADSGGDGNSSASGGKLAPNNQIIDGQTFYRDYYQEYYDQAMQILADGGEIPDRLRSIIERYFGVIV